MLLSSEREFKDSHLFCQATTYPGHRFHMDRLGFFGNNIGLARVYGMHFSKKRSWRAVLMTIPYNHKMA